MENDVVLRTVYLTRETDKRLTDLAKKIGVSKHKLMVRLISAELRGLERIQKLRKMMEPKHS